MANSPNKVVTFKDLSGNSENPTISLSSIDLYTSGYPIGYIDSSIFIEPTPYLGNVNWQKGFSCTTALPYLYKGYALCTSIGYSSNYNGTFVYIYTPKAHTSDGTWVTLSTYKISRYSTPPRCVSLPIIMSALFGSSYEDTYNEGGFQDVNSRIARVTSTSVSSLNSDSSSYNLYQIYILDPSTGEEKELDDYYVEYIE